MADTINQMLASVRGKDRVNFIPSKTFIGKKAGYIFTTGDKGTGYYEDPLLKVAESKKRDREDDGNAEVNDVNKKLTKEQAIEKLLEEGEASNVAPLDANTLQQSIMTLEKRIAKNQNMRMKFASQPEKYMESELDLHATINELFVLAASPELYHIFVHNRGMEFLLNLVTHDNTDISLAIISLLQELLDEDVIREDDHADIIIDEFLKLQGLELIIQNLSRLDETNDEDAQGVYNIMTILENLINLRPTIAIFVCLKTQILKFLLIRLKVRKFDANKLYCSEILSILLQASEENQRLICQLQGIDGIEAMLLAIAPYRKRDPASYDEQECIHNLFLSLSSVLLITEHQESFRKQEGLELMIRCLQEQKYATLCAIRVISYALTGNVNNCIKFIEAGGLKYIFPIFMGRGLPKLQHITKKNQMKSEYRLAEEMCITILSQLSIQANLINHQHELNQQELVGRILLKFYENEFEKLDRCIELFISYLNKVNMIDKQIEETIRRLEREDNDEALEEYASDENIMKMRSEGGLYTLQQLAIILGFVCSNHDKMRAKTDLKLASEGLNVTNVIDVLNGNLLTLANELEDDGDRDGGNEGSVDKDNMEENQDQSKRLSDVDDKKIMIKQQLTLVQFWVNEIIKDKN